RIHHEQCREWAADHPRGGHAPAGKARLQVCIGAGSRHAYRAKQDSRCHAKKAVVAGRKIPEEVSLNCRLEILNSPGVNARICPCSSSAQSLLIPSKRPTARKRTFWVALQRTFP